MALPTITVSPSAAAQAYRRIDGAQPGGGSTASPGFGRALESAIADAVATGHTADAASMQALAGHGDVTAVVTAVAKAELTLQTAVTIRDRVVQAYQDIMRMPI